MIFKSNMQLENLIEEVMEKGFNSRGTVIRSGNPESQVVFMELEKSPLSFMYGWDNIEDYWVVSAN